MDSSSLTLFLNTNYDPLDVKGWQIRRLPVADMLATGDIHEWAGDFFAYGLADVQVGDIIEVGMIKDEEDNQVYIHEIRIEERPGGLVPPSRRPGQTVHCPPNQMFAWKHGPYHIWKNVQNARPPKQAVPPPNAVPDQLPPAKQ